MKRTYLKKLSLALLIILTIQISVPSVFANPDIDIRGNVVGTLEVKSNERDTFDITSVKLDVFRLELASQDEYVDEYSHIYQETVYPDIDGKVSFSRPSSFCFVEIDLESLPNGYGAETSGVLIKPGKNTFNLIIAEITEFDFDILNETTTFYGENSKQLTTASEYQVDYKDSLKKAYMDNSEEVKAECIIGDERISETVNISGMSSVGLSDCLYEKGLISEEEKIKSYINLLKETGIKDEYTSDLWYAVLSYQQENKISNSMNNEISAIAYDNIYNYNNPKEYTSGFFSVYYDGDEFTEAEAKNVHTTMGQAKQWLCTELKFLVPSFEPNKTTYSVYLRRTGGSYTSIISGTNHYTTITLNLGNDNISSINVAPTCAHEFMHAIQHEYTFALPYDLLINTGAISFKEAVSTCVGIASLNNNKALSSGCGGSIKDFLKTPEYPLFDKIEDTSRHYGACLFPLYIEQEYNYFYTIRHIFEKIKATPENKYNNIYSIIDEALQDENSSLAEAYAGCMLYNYDVKSNYRRCEGNWGDSARINACPYYLEPESYTLPYMSTRYYELTGQGVSGEPNTITFTLSSRDYRSSVRLQGIITTSAGVRSTKQYHFATQDAQASYNIKKGDKFCMLISNISFSAPEDISYMVYSY